jgi:hypothetical protein
MHRAVEWGVVWCGMVWGGVTRCGVVCNVFAVV